MYIWVPKIPYYKKLCPKVHLSLQIYLKFQINEYLTFNHTVKKFHYFITNKDGDF